MVREKFWLRAKIFPVPFLILVSFYSHLPAYEEVIECSETSEYKIQTPGNYPKESIQQTEHGENLKLITQVCFCCLYMMMVHFCRNMLCVWRSMWQLCWITRGFLLKFMVLWSYLSGQSDSLKSESKDIQRKSERTRFYSETTVRFFQITRRYMPVHHIVFLLLSFILIVVYVFLLFVHVFLTLSMYSYCCLCILIVVYVYLLLSTYS